MAASRVEGGWQWSQSADFQQPDAELLQHKRLEICSYNRHLPASKRKRGASILIGGPLKQAAIQDWLLQSTRMPGSCAVSDASLVTQKQPFSLLLSKRCSKHFKDFQKVSEDRPPEPPSSVWRESEVGGDVLFGSSRRVLLKSGFQPEHVPLHDDVDAATGGRLGYPSALAILQTSAEEGCNHLFNIGRRAIPPRRNFSKLHG